MLVFNTHGLIARKLYHRLSPQPIFQSTLTAQNPLNMVSITLQLHEKNEAPPPHSQFLGRFNFLKKEKTIIFKCHQDCDELNGFKTLEMARKNFFTFPDLVFRKIMLPDYRSSNFCSMS